MHIKATVTLQGKKFFIIVKFKKNFYKKLFRFLRYFQKRTWQTRTLFVIDVTLDGDFSAWVLLPLSNFETLTWRWNLRECFQTWHTTS